ncbi:MAG: acetate kinase [Gammaproteobacteria bacterium]|nr:acetate kinase [Gammaproteobacteria bacterium]
MHKSYHEHPMHDSATRIPVAISGPHVQLTQAVIEELFCDRYRLHEHCRLAQPTRYAAQESVTLIGPHGRLTNVRVIGPPCSVNQVELSQTDGAALGVDPPVREPGDIEGTPGIIIEGPRARVRLEHGVIRPLHHVYMSPFDADRLGLRDKDRVEVAAESQDGTALLRDVCVCVSADSCLELHLDADEGNAAALHSGDYVVLRVV